MSPCASWQVRACLHYDGFFRQAETFYTTCEQRAGGLPIRVLDLVKREVGDDGSGDLVPPGTLER